MKLRVTILFCFFILSACQVNEADTVVLNEGNPEITIKLNNEEITTFTSIYCWNDCAGNEQFSQIDLTELTKGLEPIWIASGTEVEVTTSIADELIKVSYFKQKSNNFVQEFLDSNVFDIHGREGLQQYIVVVDWYDPNRETLIGRAGTNFVVEIGK